jgi:hypothetical protein
LEFLRRLGIDITLDVGAKVSAILFARDPRKGNSKPYWIGVTDCR